MSLSSRLMKDLNQGDKIRVMAGNRNIDGEGSFIEATSDFLVWADDDGDILFTHLGDAISVKKV